MTISPVIEARKPILPWITGADRPFMPFSRTKPLMSPASSLAQTIKTSAMGALVIHILQPDSENPPATFFARVAMEAGSDPEFGSVSPKQPIHSPLASFGR